MPSIFYREKGKGTPLIFIHGFCETHEIWDGFADRFAKDFRIIALDLPGFGKSKMLPGPFTIDDVARHVSDQLKENHIDEFILIGHSLGGYVSLALAAQHAGCQGLVLFHSTAKEDTAEKKVNRNRVYEFVQANGVAPFVDTFVPGLYYDQQHPSIPSVHRMALQTPQETILQYTLAMRDRPTRMPFLSTFQKPFLLLGGQHDPIITPASLEEICRETNGELALLPATAHMGMLEAPELAWSAIQSFVQKEV